ncbi:hypothetical protein [Streptomyces flavofungini]|uniref:hypothetical protein n=1 Tax=Streptomyces flavofungini TaxID=68200 RepID=UPI0025B01133|nr:hypothetical protein [Streptomyces flavofungini]WJV48056.1 hypothetical protein QUY26_22575 [Streptomyces flavofungini]
MDRILLGGEGGCPAVAGVGLGPGWSAGGLCAGEKGWFGRGAGRAKGAGDAPRRGWGASR